MPWEGKAGRLEDVGRGREVVLRVLTDGSIRVIVVVIAAVVIVVKKWERRSDFREF